MGRQARKGLDPGHLPLEAPLARSFAPIAGIPAHCTNKPPMVALRPQRATAGIPTTSPKNIHPCATPANPPLSPIKQICNGNKKSRPKAAFLYSSIDGWHIASRQYQKL